MKGDQILLPLLVIFLCHVNARNADGDTPLYVCGSQDTMRFLLMISFFGTDMSIKGSQGMTPIHHACRHGWTDVVKYLIEEKHCDPHCYDDDGVMPLHTSCDLRRVEGIEYIHSTGKVDPMAKSSPGIII